jgi:hypothetical protein
MNVFPPIEFCRLLSLALGRPPVPGLQLYMRLPHQQCLVQGANWLSSIEILHAITLVEIDGPCLPPAPDCRLKDATSGDSRKSQAGFTKSAELPYPRVGSAEVLLQNFWHNKYHKSNTLDKDSRGLGKTS